MPLGEFIFTIPEPHATLHGAVTWRNQCHDRATLQGVRIPSAILKIVFRHILFIFCLLNAVWALTSDGFRIVSDTLVTVYCTVLFATDTVSLLVKYTQKRGQSNLTKSASRGAHSPVRGHPRGSKFVPLNSWGRVSY